MSAILRFLIFLILLAAGVFLIAFYWTFYKPLPDYRAVIELRGLERPVDIHWDPFGVPHIYAEREADLYYATGYVHAQDRLWQMTLSQLVAEGRFAEFLGEELLSVDQYHRTLGFRETAERIKKESSPEILRILDAYARGVNDYVEQNRKRLPPEFALLGMEPIEWHPIHSIAISRLMAWEMNVSWWSKMLYGYLYNKLPEYVMQEIIPQSDTGGPIMMSRTDSSFQQVTETAMALLEKELDIRSLLQRSGTTPGSNTWVAAGSRTNTGLPILAGDPHMGLSIPGTWYEMHLSLNGRNLSGATIPGAPVVVLGQNSRIAWSLTNMMSDDTDFFVELTDPANPEHYLADTTAGAWQSEPFHYRNEVIRVRGGDDLLYRVRSTDHGPVITDIFPERALTDELLLSMAWTGHQVSHELEAFYRINWAEDMEDFLEALESFRSPGQNFSYADRDNNIAIISAAGLPIRNNQPLRFRNGWDPSHNWQGWIPFEDLPRVINPESGLVAHANNRLHGEDYPYYITSFWEPSSRIERIESWLQSHDTLTVEHFQELQLDTYSVHARELTESILPVLRSAVPTFDFSEILPYLENWDYRYDPESTAASIMDAFFMKLTENTLRDEMGELAYRNLIRTQRLAIRIMTRLIQNDSFLFNDESTPLIESREFMIHQSMQDAVDWLTEHHGGEPIDWRWGDLHTLTLKPPLFGEAADQENAPPLLRLIVRNLMNKGPYPVSGHSMSINKGQYNWDQPFDMVLGPAVRRIVDLDALERSYSILPTGQSGNPFSEFYGDQTELWLNGSYRFMYQDSTFFREISYQTMKLRPLNP